MKFLLIQTAFIGDVVLATPLVEKLHRFYPGAQIDFLVRKGNERLLLGHPYLQKVLVWDKKTDKYRNLRAVVRQVRRENYDYVINCQRFMASGILTVFSGARQTIGFAKNPLSRFFSSRVAHQFGTTAQPVHEVQRNLQLIAGLTDSSFERPKLYPSAEDAAKMATLAGGAPYICIAPTSVWFTKQFPAHKWVALLQALPAHIPVFLLGGPDDTAACAAIREQSGRLATVTNLSGQLSLLESAALMHGATMNYVNDSAPLHFASAMNAPVTAIFCSTVPAFGFTPLSDRSTVVEIREPLACRPCGLHGFKACPQGHFKCAEHILVTDIIGEKL